MPELSQDAIRELRLALPILRRLAETFVIEDTFCTRTDYQQLANAYARVSELTSPTELQAWVGPSIDEVIPPQEDTFDAKSTAWGVANRLYLYVQSILENEALEQTLARLTQDNASLKEQLAELSQRERAYLSIIARTTTLHSVPPEDKEFLATSYQTELTTLTKNLRRLEERRALHGLLNIPLEDLNMIEMHEERIKQVKEARANLTANKPDWF